MIDATPPPTHEQMQRRWRVSDAFNHGARDCVYRAGLDLDTDKPPFSTERQRVVEHLCSGQNAILRPEFEARVEAYKTGWGVAEDALGYNVRRPTWLWLVERSWESLVAGLDSRGAY